MSVQLRRLFPDPANTVTIAEACAAPRHRHRDGRPWVEVCMVASIDGSTAVDGRSGGLSGATDRQMFAGLRSVADVVLVGAGTVRAEGYGPPSRPGLRIGVVSRTGHVDASSPLFATGAGFLVVPADAPATKLDAVRAGTGIVDLTAALRLLPGDPGVVQVEGGPMLNGALVAAGLVDEVNLTVSPTVAGGDGSRLAIGTAQMAQSMQLTQVLLDDEGFLFARWVRSAG